MNRPIHAGLLLLLGVLKKSNFFNPGLFLMLRSETNLGGF